MKKYRKKKTGLLWKIVSIILAICLWYFVIQVRNPNDEYLANNVEINVVNEDALESQGLCIYNLEDSRLSVKLSGKKILLGKSRNYENEIKGIVDLSDYFTDKKLTLPDGEYLPIKVVLPDSLINLAKIEKQSVQYVKVFVDERVDSIRDVKVNFLNSLGSEYFLDVERKKVLPQKVELVGAKKIVDSVAELNVDVTISSEKEEIISSKVYALDKNHQEITNVSTSPEIIQVSVPVLREKTVKLNVDIKNNLAQNVNLEEIKIVPSEIQIAGTKEQLDKCSDTLNIPLEINEIEGEHQTIQKIELDDELINVRKIETIDIAYKVKIN